MTDIVELRKDRFFFRKKCAYCKGTDNLQLDSIAPYTWVKEEVWNLTDYQLDRLFVSDIQVLCDFCLRRKKQVWKKARKDGGKWLDKFLGDEFDVPSSVFGRAV